MLSTRAGRPVQPGASAWTTETPPSYERTHRRMLGLAPGGLVLAAALLTLVASVIAFATGDATVGSLFLLGVLLLAATFVEGARRHRASPLDRIAASAGDRVHALAGFTGSSARAWTSAGRAVARLRLEAHRVARERARLQYALGGAAYDEDEPRVAELRAELRRCTERLDACAREMRESVRRARSRTADERLAVAATEVRKPDAWR